MSKNINDSAQLSGGGAGGGASIKLRGTGRDFETPAGSFRALAGIDLEIDAGELVAVVGASGSGKSTLLHLIAGIDRPTSGEVWVAGRPLHDLDETMLTAFRGRHVGIVFQSFQLLPTLTVLENVVVAMDFVAMRPVGERRACALELLDRVAVADQAHKLPATLSGGQQQRVAIARALANDPALVVADEPTGNLDTRTAEQVMALLCSLAELGKTVLVVTHERDVLQRFRRVVELVDGSVLSDTRGAGAGTVTAASEARCTA